LVVIKIDQQEEFEDTKGGKKKKEFLPSWTCSLFYDGHTYYSACCISKQSNNMVPNSSYK
jgi:hypothetical protein